MGESALLLRSSVTERPKFSFVRERSEDLCKL